MEEKPTEKMCGITRIYADNININGNLTIDIELPKFCIWDRWTAEYDLKAILGLVPNLVHYGSSIPPILKDEIRTLIIVAGGIKYSKVYGPDGSTILENLENSLLSLSNSDIFEQYRTFDRSLSQTLILQDSAVPDKLNDDCLELISPIILSAFPECEAITQRGDAIMRGHTIERESMGGGYNQVLKIMYALWVVTRFKYTVYLNCWQDHLHYLLKHWLWDNILMKIKESNIEGTLIIDKMWE